MSTLTQHNIGGAMAINDWPEGERPREKLLKLGPKFLSDAELLAILIRSGNVEYSALSIGRNLIKEHGDLRSVMGLDQRKLCLQKGVGTVSYVLLQACLELGRRYLEQGLGDNPVLTSSKSTRLFLRSQLRHRTQEVFACVFLDAQHQVLRYEELFFGTIDGAAVYPRQVVTKAIEFNAAAVILSHNHPSGNPEPSSSDRQLTKTLVDALALIDVSVLDHVVVGDTKEVSFVERGLL